MDSTVDSACPAHAGRSGTGVPAVDQARASVAARLLAVEPTLGLRADPAAALRTLGIDVDQIRHRLEAAFGSNAVQTAERQVRRRSRWRGGVARPSALCVHLLAKRALHFAADHAARRGDRQIGPENLLYGVLRDARDPLGTQLSRRSRRTLAALGWVPGRPNPLRTVIDSGGADLAALTSALSNRPA